MLVPSDCSMLLLLSMYYHACFIYVLLCNYLHLFIIIRPITNIVCKPMTGHVYCIMKRSIKDKIQTVDCDI